MITTYHPDGSVTYGQSPSSSSSGTGTPNSTGMAGSRGGGSSVQPSGTYGGNGNFTPSNSNLSGSFPSSNPGVNSGGGNGGSSYSFNPNSANPDYKTELGRTQLAYNAYQQAYNQTKDPSMLQRMNDAASYGQQLRSKAGLPSSGGDYSSYYSSQYGTPTFNPTNGLSQGDSKLLNSYFQSSGTQAQPAPVNPYAALSPQLISQLFQPYQPIDYTQQAANMANPIVQGYQNNYNSLLSKLDAQRSNDLGAVKNSTEDAKSALENQYFQNYLGARQAMADRGLAGSGLANDQDTRLLLAKQQDLAGIYRDAALQQSDINNNYTNNYNDVQNQLAQVNSGQIQNQILQQLQSQGYSQYKDQQSNLANLFKDILPYAAPQQDTVLNSQTSLANNQNTVQGELMKQFLSNQGSANVANINGQYKLAGDYLPYNYQTKNNIADNATKAVTNAIDMFKAQNQASYQNGMLNIDGQRLSLDQAKFADSKDRFATEIQQKADALKNTQWNQQAQHQASLAKGYLDQAAAYQKQLSGMDSSDPMYSSVKANYDSAMQNATNAYNGLASLNNGGDGSGMTDPSMVGFPTSGTPNSSFSNFLVGQ